VALSARERLLLFEVFDIPSGSTAFEIWGVLGEGGTPQNFTFTVASDAIDYLLGLLDSTGEARLSELLAKWDEVSLEPTEIEEAEGAKGVLESSEGRRTLLKRRIRMLVPLYRDGEIAKVEREVTGGGNQILRG